MNAEKLSLAVERHVEKMNKAYLFMKDNPETGYREWKAQEHLAKEFRALGYELTLAGDVPGFYTTIDTGRPGPCVAVLGELDGLLCPLHPDSDKETFAAHVCGHNAQAAALLGLAGVLKEPHMMDGLCGSIRLMLVPAEELVEMDFREDLKQKGIIRYPGGKVEFLRRGYFDGVDIALMIHVMINKNGTGRVTKGSNGCIIKKAVFTGRSAHAGADPHKGHNALYAATNAMNTINALRETFEDEKHVRVHPIILNGGKSVNVIPDCVVMENQIRAAYVEDIRKINHVVNCAVAAAAAGMNCGVKLEDQPGYMPRRNNKVLNSVITDAMEEILESVEYHTDEIQAGCSDIGDISCLIPASHPYVGGAIGTSHGADYRIPDYERCLKEIAQVNAMTLQLLLQEDGRRAREVIASFEPVFAGKKEYFEFIDSLYLNVDAVEQQPDGNVLLRLH